MFESEQSSEYEKRIQQIKFEDNLPELQSLEMVNSSEQKNIQLNLNVLLSHCLYGTKEVLNGEKHRLYNPNVKLQKDFDNSNSIDQHRQQQSPQKQPINSVRLQMPDINNHHIQFNNDELSRVHADIPSVKKFVYQNPQQLTYNKLLKSPRHNYSPIRFEELKEYKLRNMDTSFQKNPHKFLPVFKSPKKAEIPIMDSQYCEDIDFQKSRFKYINQKDFLIGNNQSNYLNFF